jgi:nucleotide-binding universal stress UspA family protein
MASIYKMVEREPQWTFSPRPSRGSDVKDGSNMKILVALDATPECGEIVAEILSRPWPRDSSFLLLHVLDPFPFAKAPVLLERARDDARTQLKQAGQRLCAGGWAVEEDVVLGRARQKIAEIADSWKADLAVVGSNEAGALTRLLLGSTARAVLRHAPCSVEIVRPGSNTEGLLRDQGMEILVATDGSKYSASALQSVASRPWPAGSKFKVISIPEPFMPLDEFSRFAMKEIEKLNASALDDAKRYAESGAAILRNAGLEASAETPIPRDSDAREIVQEAVRCDARMIVLGSHGRRGFDRWTLGSVSEHVALHAPCSVEVIRGSMTPAGKSKKPRRKE